MGMDGYFPVKMKRKDLEEVNDDFSDFSLSSPARKIRRLDAELPPIMEEEEPDILIVQMEPPKENFPVVIDEVSSVTENEERAIVLFKPMNTPLVHSPLNFSYSLNSDLLSGFKNPVVWSSQSNFLIDDEAQKRDKEGGSSNGCLAVVPWVPNHSQYHPPIPIGEVPQMDVSQMMAAEETEAAAMDIEEDNSPQMPRNEFRGTGVNQWQQHCMIPQPPQNLSTPITWFDGQFS